MFTLSPGSIFHGRYEVVRCIKTGGMGAVYELIQLETRRRRALKVMLPAVLESVDMRARFALEATVAADIVSEHIVETMDAGIDGETGAPFLVMELLRGSDLAALVARRGRLSPADVVPLLSQAASALDRTHAAGVVHRDLKPENLFVTRRDDGSPKLKILDFGIAKIVSESGQAAAKTKVLGTPIYMSPEQVRGDGRIGPHADLYALAQIAFTLLAGKAYWAKEHDALPTYALMTKILGGCPAPASARAAQYGGATPPAFDAWFARATRVVPEERFPSAAAMIEALADALGVEIPRTRAEAVTTEPRLSGPADPAGGSTLPVPSGPATAADTPSSRQGSRTEEPASIASVASPRKRPDRKGIAGLAVVAALVVAAVALTLRPGDPRGASRPAVDPSASTATLSPMPSSPPAPVHEEGDASHATDAPVTASAHEPSAGPSDVPSPPVSIAAAAEKHAPVRHVAPSAARPAAEPSATVSTPRVAPPPSLTGDAHPARSLD